MLSFQIEPLEKCWSEAMVLAHQHWEETEEYRGQVFNPDFKRYAAYENGGWFLGFTARDKGVLAAYAGIYLVPDMHTQELLATEDAFFVAKPYRAGRNFLRFYQFIEGEIRKRGAKRIMFTAPETNGTGRLLERLDYKPVSMQYSKNLEVPPRQGDASRGANADSDIRANAMEPSDVAA